MYIRTGLATVTLAVILAPASHYLANMSGWITYAFFIEDDLVAGLQASDSLINKGEISPRDFESTLSRIGSALHELANFSAGENTIFASSINSSHCRLPPPTHMSSLTITSQLGTRQVTKVFLAIPPAETATWVASGPSQTDANEGGRCIRGACRAESGNSRGPLISNPVRATQ